MTKVYKMELLVIDFENDEPDAIINMLEGTKYVNGTVISYQEAEVEWSDDHPLNNMNTQVAAMDELFPDHSLPRLKG